MTATARYAPDGSVTIRTPYDEQLVDDYKTCIPRQYRRWDPVRKVWFFDPPWSDEAVDIARAFFPGLVVVGAAQDDVPAPDGWAVALFAALPERLHDPAYKALVKVVHPDIGGDERAAQQLNDAHRSRRRTAS